MILTSLVCLSVFCALSGCLFVVATRMYAQACGVSGRVATSSAYLLEAAGSGAGGILASAVLLRFCGSYQIAAVVLLLNLCMAAILLLPRRRIRVISTALALAVLAGFLCVAVTPWLEESSQRRLWRGFHLLESRDSIYGKLAVTETGDIRSLYDNGLILASAPDESAAEEAVHYALLEHPAPRHVLLIGGGVNGSIAQALKHPTIERIDYVELDPALVSIARQFFPVQSASFSDPRVHAHYADGRHYLKTTGEKFDVIVVNVPDPQTAQLNRFYTREFFASARGHLAPGGVLALQLRSSEDYISPDLAAFLRCIQHTLRQVFPQIAVIPGETLHFFAAMQPGVLTENPQTLITRLQARHLATHYVREYFLPFRMMPDRMAQVHEQLQPLPETPVNRDFAPIAYYFSVELWSAQFHSAYTRWFRAAAQRSFGSVLTWSCTLLLLLAILLASRPVGEKRARASAAFCVAATGFTLMAQQIFLLLLFQSVYGYVYHQLAVLIAMFMAGIALGSWLAIRQIASGIDGGLMATAASIQFFLAASVPALMLLIALLAQTSGGSATLLTAQFVFPLLAALSGMLGGYQFPVATEIYLRDGSAQRGLGTLYALDLLGGCVGALLLSGYLIRLLQEFLPVPAFFRRHLRKQEAFVVAILHQQAVLPNLDLPDIGYTPQRREHRNFVFKQAQLRCGNWPEAGIAQCREGCRVAHCHIERLASRGVTDAAAQLSLLLQGHKSAALLVERAAGTVGDLVRLSRAHCLVDRLARQGEQLIFVAGAQRERLLCTLLFLAFQQQDRAVSHNAGVVASGVARVGILQQLNLVSSHALGSDHRRHDGRSATGFPDAHRKIARHTEVVPLLQRGQRFMVLCNCLIVSVVVRQIRAGKDESVAAVNHLGQRYAQSAAALVALVAHDNGHELEAAQHTLQPGQFDFDRMLGPLRSGYMAAAGELDARVHLGQLLRECLVHDDVAERRRISVTVKHRSKVEGLVVRGRDHDHARILSSPQRGVGVGCDGSGVRISGMRRDDSNNRVGDLRRRGVR
ncbi:MAG: fused MFS/spermidine synthase [Candidatus Korobacteraceae bacterium]